MIEKQVVDEVIARSEIESVISPYVTLKRAGNNMVGLCPFHSERSPSFTVFTGENSFYCFGCGVGGNAITFLRKIENIEFTEAVQILAKRVGIKVIETDKRRGQGKTYDRERMYAMNRDAARFFHQSLFANTPNAAEARAYFFDKRKLSKETVKHFGLGYAPLEYGVFIQHMQKLGYKEDELIAGFLCGKSTSANQLYPNFRGRVIFPILDVSGNVIAFGGRVMDNMNPKYKNSSDTPVFKKRNSLFALNFSHKFCKDRLILCEGYMDVIAVHAAGFSYAVATLGTAITPEQARLMSRYTKEVIIAYDTDEAGQKAAEKALRLFDEVGLACRVLDMQGAKDPDEYIQKFGVEQFKTLLTQSQTKFEFNYHKVISKFNLRDPQQKIEAVALLCQQIASTYSASEQDIYIRECAERLTVDADSLRKDVARLVRKNQRQDMQKDKERRHVSFSGATDRTNKDFSKSPQAARAEEAILGILQLRPEVRSLCFASPPLLEEKDFFTTLGQRIFAFIANGEITGGVDLAMADAFFTTDEVSRMTKMRVDRMRLSENGIDAFKECILRMKQAKQEYTIENQDISIGELGDYLEAMRKKKEEEKE